MRTITIGFTKSDRFGANYIAACDGWKVGVDQETVTIELDGSDDASDQEVAELVFVATNVPVVDYLDTESLRDTFELLQRLSKEDLGKIRSLSVGDTVTVDGRTLACDHIGWRDVTAEIDEYELSLGAALAREADVEVERA